MVISGDNNMIGIGEPGRLEEDSFRNIEGEFVLATYLCYCLDLNVSSRIV